MTEAEWLACEEPERMHSLLRGRGSERKLRLYLCASYRTIISDRLPGTVRTAFLVQERFAEGLASRKELLDARSRAWEAVTRFAEQNCRSRSVPDAENRLHHALITAIARGTDPELDQLHRLAIPQLLLMRDGGYQAGLLHDVFGNPFRQAPFDPAMQITVVTSLAQAAYDERILPSGHLDPARLAVLSDALEEAGCTDADLLTHLRSAGPHVRGCWALDLVLGKE